MQEICTSGSMSGDWKRSHGGGTGIGESRRQQLPPNAYRYRPSCRLYPHSQLTPFHPFPPVTPYPQNQRRGPTPNTKPINTEQLNRSLRSRFRTPPVRQKPRRTLRARFKQRFAQKPNQDQTENQRTTSRTRKRIHARTYWLRHNIKGRKKAHPPSIRYFGPPMASQERRSQRV